MKAMGKIWMSFALLLVLPLFLGLTVFPVRSAVVTWDDSAGFKDGTPFAPTDVISYEVSVSKDKQTLVVLGEIGHGPFTVTLPSEGEWFVAVRTVRLITNEKYYSDYLWSDDLGNPIPFKLSFYKDLVAPTELRMQ